MATEVVRGLVADAVEIKRGLGLLADVERVRCFGLQAPGEFVGGDHRIEFRIVTAGLNQLFVVDRAEEIKLALLLGTVDGLVRRDLRRWQGGRESSFVYHHAKRYTGWALTGGFGLYLTWPFGGFNPAYMVLVFTVLVAATLSTTVASFKKYV